MLLAAAAAALPEEADERAEEAEALCAAAEAGGDEAVAALLIATFPRYPTTFSDNRCHLQAFRHLYVLAAEKRCVDAVERRRLSSIDATTSAAPAFGLLTWPTRCRTLLKVSCT